MAEGFKKFAVKKKTTAYSAHQAHQGKDYYKNTFVVSPLGHHQIMQAFFSYPLWIFDLEKIAIIGYFHNTLSNNRKN